MDEANQLEHYDNGGKKAGYTLTQSLSVPMTSHQVSASPAPRNCNLNCKPSLEFAFNIKIGNESIDAARTFRTFLLY